MNKPTPRVEPDDDIGPLDENDQQIWSPEEEAAVERVTSDPQFLAEIAAADADIDAGHYYTQEEAQAYMAEVRRRFLAERGL